MGAQVTIIGNQPNGKNINLNCGSTNTDLLKKIVVEESADIGIALDGDADRMIIVDEKGEEVDGNLLFAAIVKNWNDRGLLENKSVASTIMANFALENYLSSLGIDLVRTNVGDRHLVKSMRENNLKIGGEPSGHIVMSNFGTTGDGLVASLQVLSMMSSEDRPISELVNLFELYPQKNISIPISGNNSLNDPAVKKIIKEQELLLDNNGRIMVRKSGTEPIIRVMVESKEEARINNICEKIVSSIEKSFHNKN